MNLILASGTEISAAIHLSPDVGPPGSIQFPFGFVTYSVQASLYQSATAPISTTLISSVLPDRAQPPITTTSTARRRRTPPRIGTASSTTPRPTATTRRAQGAKFGSGGLYNLILIDGGRGDDDGIKNGVISATGGLAITAATDPYAVTNTNDSGAGSLRQAIINANAAPGVVHTITFALPSGPQTITLAKSASGDRRSAHRRGRCDAKRHDRHFLGKRFR